MVGSTRLGASVVVVTLVDGFNGSNEAMVRAGCGDVSSLNAFSVSLRGYADGRVASRLFLRRFRMNHNTAAIATTTTPATTPPAIAPTLEEPELDVLELPPVAASDCVGAGKPEEEDGTDEVALLLH